MSRKKLDAVNATVADQTVTDADLSAITAQLEAQDLQNGSDEDQAPSGQAPAPEESAPEGETLLQIAESFPEDQRLALALAVGKAYDDRSTFERTKNPANDRIHVNLAKSRNKLTLPSAAAILMAAKVEPDFINRSLSTGARFNVYAADKLADLVKGLRDGRIANAVNIAICKSLFAFRTAGEPFTGEMAKAACCDKVKVSAAMKAILIRHTVDPGTMSTQTSSTMTALQTLGIVENQGTAKHPVYALTNSPQTDRLQQVLAA